jgi:hypothetical protein
MVPLFGWSDPLPDVSGLQPRWDEAEAGTNRAMAHVFADLSDSERQELSDLIAAANA